MFKQLSLLGQPEKMDTVILLQFQGFGCSRLCSRFTSMQGLTSLWLLYTVAHWALTLHIWALTRASPLSSPWTMAFADSIGKILSDPQEQESFLGVLPHSSAIFVALGR